MNDELEFTTRIDRLAPEQRQLLAVRLAQLGAASSVPPADDRADEDLRLVAYVVPGQTGGVEVSELRRRLEEKLPAYMIPAQIVLLDALPLTPNGKVDLNRLLAADEVSLARGEPADLKDLPSGGSWIEPRNESERDVARVWAELLGMEALSVEDNFFELGGHSLLVMRMLAQLGEQFKVEVPVSAFFQAPTIASLARLIQALRLARSSPASKGDAARESFEL
jgi:acyl carrier protein